MDRATLETNFVKIVPLNAAETVTLNVHHDSALYLVRYYTDEEILRRNLVVNMAIYRISDAAAQTLRELTEEVVEKLKYLAIGMEEEGRYQLDDKHFYLSLDPESGIVHFRHFYLNSATGERLPSKRGCSISLTDTLEFFRCLPICMQYAAEMED